MFNVAAIWAGGVLTIFGSPHLVSNIEMAKGKNGHLLMSKVRLYKPSESDYIHRLYTVYEPKRTMSSCHAEAPVHLCVRENLYSPFTCTQNLTKLAQTAQDWGYTHFRGSNCDELMHLFYQKVFSNH